MRTYSPGRDGSQAVPFAKRLSASICALALSALVSACSISQQELASENPTQPASQPNILVIVADDLGYSDIGAFGGEISTPNLNRLASEGLMLTNMHAAPTCSPTRAMLLTGVDAHRVGLGMMAETPMPVRPAGYEGHLLRNAATVAERLSDQGYATLMSGKWHLGKAPEQWPASRGFGRSFALLDGAANHFGFDQTGAWADTYLSASYVEDTHRARYPQGEFSSDVFANKMIEYIASTPDDQPIFGYLTFTAPHWPLQAPADEIARYKGAYDAGPAALRKARIARMKALGLVDPAAEDPPLFTETEWQNLSSEDRAAEARKMEIYAAMVHHLDTAIGKVLKTLKDEGRLDNTLVIFLSDNGADGGSTQSTMRLLNITDPEHFGIDNSLENLGSPSSFVSYGPDWAQASTASFNRFKGFTTEGGTRVPAIVYGPGVKSGRSNALLHVTDLLPTLLDYTQAGDTGQRADLLAPTGHSMLPIFTQKTNHIRTSEQALGYEFFSGGALWKGDWKLLRLPLKSPMTPLGAEKVEWRLYNLAEDLSETRDLSAVHPAIRVQMLKDWDEYVSSSNIKVGH